MNAALLLRRTLISIVHYLLLAAYLNKGSAAEQTGAFAASRSIDAIPLEELDWVRVQATYASQISSRVDHVEAVDFVFYGDSIVESLHGTVRGTAYAKAADIPAVWKKHFGTWEALALGIAGDRTVNLLWRITEGGESIPALKVKSIVVLIGTNDFYNHYEQLYGALPMNEVALVASEIANGIIANALALHRRHRSASIMVLGILPRGDVEPGMPDVGVYSYTLPSMFTPHIVLINQQLEEFAAAHAAIDYLDCGHVFVESTAMGRRINAELMADALHPTAKGMDALLGCIKPRLVPPAHRWRSDGGAAK